MPADPMTDEQLEAWEALANEATPGPWRVCKPCDDRGKPCGLVWSADGETQPALISDEQCDTKRSAKQLQADGRLIAASRTAVPALVAEVRRLRSALAECGRAGCPTAARAALPPAKKPGGNDG